MVAGTHKLSIKSELAIKRSTTSMWWIAMSLLALLFVPYLLLWDEAYIRIYDTLEGIDYQLLFASGKLFDYSLGATVEQVMLGQPRMAIKTGWSFVALWHWFFGLYGGYIFNYVLVHGLSFLGMYLLLHQHLVPDRRNLPIALGVAVCFAWVPVFSMLGLTVAGQPLVAWAFLNILKNNKARHPAARPGLGAKFWPSWLVLSLFPFYADIVWAGIPVLAFAGGYFLYDYVKTGRWSWPYMAALAWVSTLFIAANWQLFTLTFLSDGFVSHREEYDFFYNKKLSLLQSTLSSLEVFSVSYFNTGITVSLAILAAALLAWCLSATGARHLKLLALIVSLSLFYGFYNWLIWLAGDYFNLLKSFKFERAVVLLPLLWMMLMGLSLAKLLAIGTTAAKRLVAAFLAFQFLIGIFANDEFSHNIRQLAGMPRKPNFKAFFDEELFGKISGHIGLTKDQYRIVCLGMHPSVAQYNGFYTLDAHMSLYPLEYKHRFRQVIAGELAKNKVIRNEFDNFGNRCYLYSAELGKDYDAFLCGKDEGRQVQQLVLNSEVLCQMGGCYLLSAVEILNAGETGLHLQKVFEGRFWKIHLYEVNGKPQVVKNIQPIQYENKTVQL